MNKKIPNRRYVKPDVFSQSLQTGERFIASLLLAGLDDPIKLETILCLYLKYPARRNEPAVVDGHFNIVYYFEAPDEGFEEFYKVLRDAFIPNANVERFADTCVVRVRHNYHGMADFDDYLKEHNRLTKQTTISKELYKFFGAYRFDLLYLLIAGKRKGWLDYRELKDEERKDHNDGFFMITIKDGMKLTSRELSLKSQLLFLIITIFMRKRSENKQFVFSENANKERYFVCISKKA